MLVTEDLGAFLATTQTNARLFPGGGGSKLGAGPSPFGMGTVPAKCLPGKLPPRPGTPYSIGPRKGKAEGDPDGHVTILRRIRRPPIASPTVGRGPVRGDVTVSDRITASDCCSGASAGLNSLSNVSWCLLFLFSFFLSFLSFSGSSLSSLSWDLECIFFGRRGSRANLQETAV